MVSGEVNGQVPGPEGGAPADPGPRRSALARLVFPDRPGTSEPDPRFTLANERTFLAWVRTSVAFIGAGVALEAFVPAPGLGAERNALAVLLIVLGTLVGVTAGVRWWRVESAMRASRPLPLPLALPLLVMVVGAGGALAAFFVLMAG